MSGMRPSDQTKPGHASMVHGELGGAACEVVSASGVCVASMTALKYAWMNVAAGLVDNAVATGSELSSSYLKAALCSEMPTFSAFDLESQPSLAFEADFLRWMLSDGAGAAFLSGNPPQNRRALRIDWIEIVSFAICSTLYVFRGGEKPRWNADRLARIRPRGSRPSSRHERQAGRQITQ